MSGYQFTPQATEDFLQVWSFIAEDNLPAANRVEAAIFEACDLLSRSPAAGQTRKDLTQLPVRFWIVHPYPNYIIVYKPESEPVQIIRILHGARDLPSALR